MITLHPGVVAITSLLLLCIALGQATTERPQGKWTLRLLVLALLNFVAVIYVVFVMPRP